MKVCQRDYVRLPSVMKSITPLSMQFKVFEIEKTLKEALLEDGAAWDWTARGSVALKKQKTITAHVVGKSDGVWAGAPVVQAMSRLNKIQIKTLVEQGQSFKKGQKLLRWTGPAEEILAFERPFLNLTMFACGIAGQARTLVTLVEKTAKNKKLKIIPRVTATRKTLPGYKDLSIEAVLAGRAFSHRLNLASGILIKENHIRAAGSIRLAVQGVQSIAPHGLKVEVEVTNLKELDEALHAGAEAVLLDNFTPKDVAKAVQSLEGIPVLVEVSGGINAQNIADYVIEGVHIISSGSITHTVIPADLSLLVD